MNRMGRCTQRGRALLLWGLAILLPAGHLRAGDRRYYECVLDRVLASGGDVVLLLGLEDGQVRQHALRAASEPYTACRMREHGLRVEGTRLSGPMQVQVGPGVEKVELDVALDRGGTYLVAHGCPDPPRKVEGNVAVEGPRDGASKQWVLWLQDAFGPGTRLGLFFDADRQAKALTALPAVAAGYNRGRHPVDIAKLAFDGTNLAGEVGITVLPSRVTKWLSAWMPAHRRSAEGLIRVKASLDGKGKAGSYSAVFGIERWREGRVLVKPATEARMRALIEPVLPPQTPWRVWLVTGPRITRGRDAQLTVAPRAQKYDAQTAQLSPVAPADWSGRRYDDGLWGRYLDDLFGLMGAYGVSTESRDPALLCLRTRFGVSEPARAADVKVTVEYLGGAVVYVNGVEVGRSHLPEGRLEPHTPAADYPLQVYIAGVQRVSPVDDPQPGTDHPIQVRAADGQTPLPGLAFGAQPQAKWFSRYQARVRTMTVPVPRRLLVKGGNVLAVEVHRAPVCGPMHPRSAWSHLGIREVNVTSPTGAGLIPFAKALEGTRIWSAQATEQITEDPFPRSRIAGGWSDFSREVYGARGVSVTGIAMGNPFDPVLPLRILVPRNGVGHGQVVLSDPRGLRRLSAVPGDFTGHGKAALPANALRIRFAAQGPDFHWCDDLLDKPTEGAKTVPVWLQVRAPRDQPPGWYVSTLSLEANGKTFRVPVQVFITGFTVPDARNLRSLIGVMHSPDSLADAYQVRPWSDEHFALMAGSLEMAGQLGNDIMYVPVIIGTHMGHKTGLIRWVKTAKGLQPDFSLFEKYLDLYAKHCAPPQAISLYVWSPETAVWTRETPDGLSSARVAARTGKRGRPLEVTQWDPRTQAAENVAAPAFLAQGAEAFWKPMLDGVRRIVVRRGWSERIILLGCGGDNRPAPRTGELLRQWAPYARWDIYSHYVGDPGPSPSGKMIAVGDLEVGRKEYPWGDESAWLKKLDFLDMPLQRAYFYDQSPPMPFRTLPMLSGRLARVGLDFWPENVRYGPLIWGLYPIRLAGRGPHGPLPTVRLAMMREALQDFEARLVILQALSGLPADEREAHRRLLDDLRRRMGTGNAYLSQMELNLDWLGYVARLYRAAEDLTGLKTQARWDEPPR